MHFNVKKRKSKNIFQIFVQPKSCYSSNQSIRLLYEAHDLTSMAVKVNFMSWWWTSFKCITIHNQLMKYPSYKSTNISIIKICNDNGSIFCILMYFSPSPFSSLLFPYLCSSPFSCYLFYRTLSIWKLDTHPNIVVLSPQSTSFNCSFSLLYRFLSQW